MTPLAHLLLFLASLAGRSRGSLCLGQSCCSQRSSMMHRFNCGQGRGGGRAITAGLFRRRLSLVENHTHTLMLLPFGISFNPFLFITVWIKHQNTEYSKCELVTVVDTGIEPRSPGSYMCQARSAGLPLHHRRCTAASVTFSVALVSMIKAHAPLYLCRLVVSVVPSSWPYLVQCLVFIDGSGSRWDRINSSLEVPDVPSAFNTLFWAEMGS